MSRRLSVGTNAVVDSPHTMTYGRNGSLPRVDKTGVATQRTETDRRRDIVGVPIVGQHWITLPLGLHDIPSNATLIHPSASLIANTALG